MTDGDKPGNDASATTGNPRPDAAQQENAPTQPAKLTTTAPKPLGNFMVKGSSPSYIAPKRAGGPVDWEMWGSMPTAMLWEAVALSLGCDPGDDVPPDPNDFHDDYPKRLRIAEAHLAHGKTLTCVAGHIGTLGATVALPDFATWALSLGWKLPAKFPRPPLMPASPVAAPANKSGKELGAKERHTLLTVIAALCKHSAIDYRARGAAGEIVRIVEELGASVGDDAIRAMLAKIPNALETRMK